MANAVARFDFSVTQDKVSELVSRIVAAVDPLEVIAFGSRARGDHRINSDLDLAVIVEDEAASRSRMDHVQDGLWLCVDLLTVSKERYDKFRPWINTVHERIDQEGVRLYERSGKPADRSAFSRLCG